MSYMSKANRRKMSGLPYGNEKYSLPIVGDYLYRYDRMRDDMRREQDYQRHVGRQYAYSTSGFGAQAYYQAGQLGADVFRMVGRQYRRMT